MVYAYNHNFSIRCFCAAWGRSKQAEEGADSKAHLDGYLAKRSFDQDGQPATSGQSDGRSCGERETEFFFYDGYSAAVPIEREAQTAPKNRSLVFVGGKKILC